MMSASRSVAPKNIWRTEFTIEELNHYSRDTLAQRIGIEVTEIGPDYVRATMPVNAYTHQPMGVLHGGASMALAETLASTAANLCVDQSRYFCVGQEINANHVRSASSGIVTGTARACHIGGRSQVWHVEIQDELGKLISVSRMTLAIVERPAPAGASPNATREETPT